MNQTTECFVHTVETPGSGGCRSRRAPQLQAETSTLPSPVLRTPGVVRTPGVRNLPGGTLVTVGPLSVLLTGVDGDGGFLLAGTVTPATLRQGAADLYARTRVVSE